MKDNLALYHHIMGEMWSDEHRKAGAAKRQAGLRQARSYRRAGRPSIRNIVKASQGSRAAVFKRIRNGGCKTKNSLSNQLDYVNDKAAFTYSTMTNTLSASAVLTEGQKDKIIDQWASTWRGSSKLGFTSHMLLSFPKDVTADQVRDIAMDWCEHFFESGHYGDEWDYVLAVHTDREHPHAHILLNNRGNDHGQWFACWAEGVMSPQLMREKQAEIAETYGVALDATTRLERGIFAKPAGLEEIYAAKAEGRIASEVALTAQEKAMARAAMVEFAKDYRDVADILDRGDKAHLSKTVREMAKALDAGKEWITEKGDIDMAEIKTVGEAIEFAETRIDAIQERAAGLGEPDRSQFEIKAAPVIASLSQMVPDPELRTRYNEVLVEPYPPGVDAKDLAAAFAEGQQSDELKEILEYGKSIGLNTDDTLARLEAGGTKNHGLAQEWVDRDLTAILAAQDIQLNKATPEQVEEAIEKLDAFQLRLAEELGVDMSSAFSVLEQEENLENAIDDGIQAEITRLRSEGYSNAQIAERSLEIEDDVRMRLDNHPELVSLSPDDRRVFEAFEERVSEMDFDYASAVDNDDRALGQAQVEETRKELVAFASKSEIHATLASRVWGDATDEQLTENYDTANHYIRTLAQELREGGLTEEQEEGMERTLVAELHKELGDEGMAELDRGHFEILEDILPSKYDQIGVTQEYLEIVAEERGLPELSDLAGELQQQKVTEKANEATIEETQKDRGLNDDMGL